MTEPKPTQEDLRASETRYRRLFESARDGILILDAVTLKITDVNPFMVELLGYSRDEFLGKELWEIGLFIDKEESHTLARQARARRNGAEGGCSGLSTKTRTPVSALQLFGDHHGSTFGEPTVIRTAPRDAALAPRVGA